MRSCRVFLVPLVLGLALPVAAKETAAARTSALLDIFKTLKESKDDAPLAEADRKANEAVFKQLDDFFDYETLTSEPLLAHKSKLTDAQRAKIQPVFQELIRLVAFPKSCSFLREAQVKVTAGKSEGDVAEVVVHAAVPKKDMESTVLFRWREKKGAFRVVDVSFDGSSLMKDYRNQFGRIIEKEGGDGLVKKLTTRLEQEKKKQGL